VNLRVNHSGLFVQTGESALCKAAAAGHIAVLQLLVDRGADVHHQDQVGGPGQLLIVETKQAQ
jgi:ankyrin repeat protein